MLVKIKRKIIDKKLRIGVKNTELRKRYYKFMRIQSLKNFDTKGYVKYQKLLSSLPYNSKINNLCYITGRERGVTRGFRLSRHQIRDKFKYLNGLTNSSW